MFSSIKTAEEIATEEAAATQEALLAQRTSAYSNPSTGSDRFFLEAARKDAAGDVAGAEAARAAGLSRVEEIKLEYPLS